MANDGNQSSTSIAMFGSDAWYRQYWKRNEIRQELYKTLRATCLYWETSSGLNEVETEIFANIRLARRILDFGAGDNRLKRKVLASGFSGQYDTLDLSPEEEHTYRELTQVEGTYDAVLCLEVIEHMMLNEYVSTMDALCELLGPDGVLVVSTPNPLCVVPMWAGDAGHVQQYPLVDLAADLVVRGFEVKAYRVRYGKPKGVWARARFFAQRVLAYLLGADYANGLLVIGKRSPKQMV